jgi:hypothetical protein
MHVIFVDSFNEIKNVNCVTFDYVRAQKVSKENFNTEENLCFGQHIGA